MAAKQAPQGQMLDVPWLSQLGPSAGFAAGDCGPAVTAMLLRYAGLEVTVDDVSRATRLPVGFRFTNYHNLIEAARAWGLGLRWVAGQRLHDIAAQIAVGWPVIALVYYQALPAPKCYDPSYPYSHWLLVTGVIGEMVYYHDPYFFKRENGANVKITQADFYSSWHQNHRAGNPQYNGGLLIVDSEVRL